MAQRWMQQKMLRARANGTQRAEPDCAFNDIVTSEVRRFAKAKVARPKPPVVYKEIEVDPNEWVRANNRHKDVKPLVMELAAREGSCEIYRGPITARMRRTAARRARA